MKKRPSDLQLRESLRVGHFGADDGPLESSDPVAKTPMLLPIGEIELYDHNPRHLRNDKYTELKDSIRAQGLRQPLVVTRRPGAERYMLRYGGNTRLTILRELHTETDADAFATAPCLFEPWTTETDVLVGHLVENETRGELVFIDKARALRAVRQMIEDETGQSVSMRQLADILRDKGYRISAPIISYCEYATSVLAEAIPQALDAGIGRPQVQRLRQLDHAAQHVWDAHRLGDETMYRAVFCEALAEVDASEWDFDHARRSIESALAERADVEPRYISLELGGEIEVSLPDIGPRTASPELGNLDGMVSIASLELDFGATPDPIGLLHQVSSAPQSEHAGPATSPALATLAGVSASPVSAQPQPCEPATPAPKPTPDKLHALRDALRARAQTYADLVGLAPCLRIEGSPWIRLGYIVADWPPSTGPEDRDTQAWSWFELTRCCELLPIAGRIEQRYADDPDGKQQVLTALFGPNPAYLEAWATPQTFAEALEQVLGGFDLQQFAVYAERIDERGWQAGLHLLQAYRDLKVYARSRAVNLMRYDFGSGVP